jgi:hypothetical protein
LFSGGSGGSGGSGSNDSGNGSDSDSDRDNVLRQRWYDGMKLGIERALCERFGKDKHDC